MQEEMPKTQAFEFVNRSPYVLTYPPKRQEIAESVPSPPEEKPLPTAREKRISGEIQILILQVLISLLLVLFFCFTKTYPNTFTERTVQGYRSLTTLHEWRISDYFEPIESEPSEKEAASQTETVENAAN